MLIPIDPESVKLTGTDNKLVKGGFEIELDEMGMEIEGWFYWESPNGTSQKIVQDNQISVDHGTEKAGVMTIVRGTGYDGEAWRNVSTGHAKIEDDLSMHIDVNRVGREKAG